MPEYTKYKRGSEWRKWDLHIHTPGTKKNDQFEGRTLDEKWQKYVETINTSPIDIRVLGITDYFCIENYFKFKELVANNSVTKNIDLILPNIELRVIPATASSNPINIHCIFNPSIDTEIETRFLSKLDFSYSGSHYSAKREELIRLGRDLPGNGALDEVGAFKAGVGQYVISMDALKSLFEKDVELRKNTIIVVSNKSTDGATGITYHADFFTGTHTSQLDATRFSIYQFADAIFSSNEKDTLYFTGNGADAKNVVIEKCGKLMPCYYGCDAHENSKIFLPVNNRFCWIKADPTFEGLRQTLYEPQDRVKIQWQKPDVKNERYVITEIKFLDSGKLFGNNRILLNENLNAIIGGKSSGKSLLLHSIANSIDPEQVARISKRLEFEGYKFGEPYDFEVTWKNGEKDQMNDNVLSNKIRKITYIPQLYINYLAEKNNKYELNSLIQSILLQDVNFKTFYEQKVMQIGEITEKVDTSLITMLQTRERAIEIGQKLKENGTSTAIANSIQNMERQIAEVQKSTNLSEEETKRFSDLAAQKSEFDIRKKELQTSEQIIYKMISAVRNAWTAVVGEKTPEGLIINKGQLERIIGEYLNVSADVIKIKDLIISNYGDFMEHLKKTIESLDIHKRLTEVDIQLAKIKTDMEPFTKKLNEQIELKKLKETFEKEIQKKTISVTYEAQYRTLTEEYFNLQGYISDLLVKRYACYKEIVEKINRTKNNIGEDISLMCVLRYKRDSFDFYNQANKAAIGRDHKFNALFQDEDVIYDLVPVLFNSIKKITNDALSLKDGQDYPLKQKITIEEILQGLVHDAFEFDYVVTYKNDELLQMSPGKKGTVLLILFLQISSSEYPILIDQPEDNLDNRTIYDLLCSMIKEKKKNRQIIIVSHNANLVVATDTENVIVANQEGQETVITLSKYQFDYVNGALEYTFKNDDATDGILFQRGIREHVCDILEGGDEAFKQREKKYSISDRY